MQPAMQPAVSRAASSTARLTPGPAFFKVSVERYVAPFSKSIEDTSKARGMDELPVWEVEDLET